MSDRITLAPGQGSASYGFWGSSFAEIGRKLDDFYRRLDYNEVEPSTDISLRIDLRHLASLQEGIIRTSIGGYEADVDVSRRERGN